MTKKKKIILFSSIGGVLVVGVVLLILGLTVWNNKDNPDENPVNPPIVETLEPSVTSFAVTASPETNQYVFTLIVVMEDMKVTSAVVNENTYILTTSNQTKLSDNSYKYVFYEADIEKDKIFTLNGVYFSGLNGKESKVVETEITKQVKLENPVEFKKWEIENNTIDIYNELTSVLTVETFNPYNINLEANFEYDNDNITIIKEDQTFDQDTQISTTNYSINVLKSINVGDYNISLKNITFLYLNNNENIDVNTNKIITIVNNYPVLQNISVINGQSKHTYVKFEIKGSNLNKVKKVMDDDNNLYDVEYDEEQNVYFFRKYVEMSDTSLTIKGFVNEKNDNVFLDTNLNTDYENLSDYSVVYEVVQNDENVYENENKKVLLKFPNDNVKKVTIDGEEINVLLNTLSYETTKTEFTISSVVYYSQDQKETFEYLVDDTVELKYIEDIKSFDISYDKDIYCSGDNVVITLDLDREVNEDAIKSVDIEMKESVNYEFKNNSQIEITLSSSEAMNYEYGFIVLTLKDDVILKKSYSIKLAYLENFYSIRANVLNGVIQNIVIDSEFNVEVKSVKFSLYIDNQDPETYTVTAVDNGDGSYINLNLFVNDFQDYLLSLSENAVINAKIKVISLTYEYNDEVKTDQLNVYYDIKIVNMN